MRGSHVAGRVVVAVATLAVWNATLAPSGAQALNEAFLQSTVLVSYSAGPNNTPTGSGFFVFRQLEAKQGHVILVTNRHVLPPEGAQKAITVRVSTKTLDKTQVRLIDVPVVGPTGRYLPNVKLHSSPGSDVAVVNATDTIVRENVQGAWIPLELFATPAKLKAENITIGDEIFLLGYPAAIFDPRNVSPFSERGSLRRSQRRATRSMKP